MRPVQFDRVEAKPFCVAGGAGSRGLEPAEELALPEGPSGPLCTPVTAIAGLAIVEAVATGRGLNPDTPAGLTKVTKTL